jgi:hypothetical protein
MFLSHFKSCYHVAVTQIVHVKLKQPYCKKRILTMKIKRLLKKAISNPDNIHFTEVIGLAEAFGFKLSRVKGSHHIFIHHQTRELLNFQNVSGMAKPYQVKQLLKIVEKYNLRLGETK